MHEKMKKGSSREGASSFEKEKVFDEGASSLEKEQVPWRRRNFLWRTETVPVEKGNCTFSLYMKGKFKGKLVFGCRTE